MSVDTFLSRLCALVPPATLPHDEVLRGLRQPAPPPRVGHPDLAAATRADPALFAPGLPDELREATSTPRRVGRASLLARVFAVDVTVCSKCCGKMRILEVVAAPAAIAEFLHIRGRRGVAHRPRRRNPQSLGVDSAAWIRRHVSRGLAAFEEIAAPIAGRFSVGDQLSIADLVLLPELAFARRFDIDLAGAPTLLRIEAACLELPCFVAADPMRQPDAPREPAG